MKVASIILVLAVTIAAPGTFASPPVSTEIAVPAGACAAQPFLFASEAGLLLSWLEPVAGTTRTALRFARLLGGRWSEARTIVERDDLFVNWADFPSIVEDENGTLFAHWLQRSGTSTYAYDVKLATSTDGGRTWSAPLLLNRDGTKTEHGFASLAPLPKGGIGVAWLDGRNMPEGREDGSMTVRYATVSSQGAIGSNVQLDDRTCECCTTALAIASGRPVVAYRDRSTQEIRDIAVVRAMRHGWSQPHLVNADGWKIAGCPVNGPQLAAAGDRVALAWLTAANDQGRVLLAFSDDGGATFGRPIRVDDGNPAGRVDVVMLDRDTAAVTWLEQTASGAELRARRVSRGGPVGSSVMVATSSAARAAGFARAAVLGNEVYVAWTDQTAGTKRVRMNVLRF